MHLDSNEVQQLQTLPTPSHLTTVNRPVDD